MSKKRVSKGLDELLSCIVKTMQDKKANDIISLNLTKIQSAVTDYFVICHGNSKTQVDAIADHIIENVRNETGNILYHFEGYENSEWILIDYVDVVVHVFLNTTRSFYQLEDLWADAEIVAYEE
ncbi:MAG: ribosome silencing factor [Bacteroidales bacterium]|nr:ribosome silencing factor [Bacteroidales bacterium]